MILRSLVPQKDACRDTLSALLTLIFVAHAYARFLLVTGHLPPVPPQARALLPWLQDRGAGFPHESDVDDTSWGWRSPSFKFMTEHPI